YVGDRVVPCDGEPRSVQPGGVRVDVVDREGRMRLARWREVGLDTDVQLEVVVGEPHSAASGQDRRLGDLTQTERIAVETPRCVLTARRARDLDVVQLHGGSFSGGRVSYRHAMR